MGSFIRCYDFLGGPRFPLSHAPASLASLEPNALPLLAAASLNTSQTRPLLTIQILLWWLYICSLALYLCCCCFLAVSIIAAAPAASLFFPFICFCFIYPPTANPRKKGRGQPNRPFPLSFTKPLLSPFLKILIPLHKNGKKNRKQDTHPIKKRENK